MEMVILPYQLIKRRKIMDREEMKSKILKGFTIVLPILLVAVLAMLIVVAMNLLKDEGSVPVLNDSVSSTSSEEIEEPIDEPIEDPSSKGLSFVSNADGTCKLNGLGECKDSFIIVPSMSPDGDIVVGIDDGAFKNVSSIKGIELPSTIKSIGAYAFYGSSIREIIIPGTVEEIGNYALCGCKYLSKIEVDEDNDQYSSISGALYNADGSILITYPAGKTDNFVNISRDVVKITNMAFYRCSSIKKVNYHGTSASWQSVEIGAGNEVIDEAFIYCAGDSGK
jgi:hypothetical protein